VTFNFEGVPGAMKRSADTAALEGWLALRAFELEQRRVEVLQASVLEKQRLRREIIAANARAVIREQERQAELRRLEELQQRLEAERIARAEAEAKRKAEEEAARLAAEEAARKAAEEEAARLAAEEEAARKAAKEEAARKAVEEEAARQQILNEAMPKTGGSKAGITVRELPTPPADIGPRTKPQPRSNTLFENLDRLFQ
jgi:membrane protein involved in colicin uptake